jgi:hypothetical protein
VKPGVFTNTVSALCYDLARSHDPGSLPCNDVVRFALRQHARLPVFLRWPLRWATIAFGLAGATPYWRRSVEARRRRCESWRQSRLGPCRDLIRFYESLTVMALYSRRHD